MSSCMDLYTFAVYTKDTVHFRATMHQCMSILQKYVYLCMYARVHMYCGFASVHKCEFTEAARQVHCRLRRPAARRHHLAASK
jgi:hypothetical protein